MRAACAVFRSIFQDNKASSEGPRFDCGPRISQPQQSLRGDSSLRLKSGSARNAADGIKAVSDVNDAAGHVLVTAYALERPDGQWAVMLVNRDQSNDHAVKVAFDAGGHHEKHFTGSVERVTFGSNEYQWHREGVGGHADPDGPPSRSTVAGGADALYQIPKASITVLRGKIGP